MRIGMSNKSFRLCAGQYCPWVLESVSSPFLCNTASCCISWHLNAEAPCAIFACSLSAKLPARAVLQASSVLSVPTDRIPSHLTSNRQRGCLGIFKTPKRGAMKRRMRHQRTYVHELRRSRAFTYGRRCDPVHETTVIFGINTTR